MSGLAAPDASVPEKIVSFALPLAAGAAAAIHPAGARGLAGLTSAVNTQLATREVGRREQADRDLGMRLTDLLGKETGEQIPTGQMIPDVAGQADVAGTPEGQLPTPPPKPEMRPQRLSDVLGKGQTGLIQALAGTPTYAREAAGLLSSQMLPKPQYHVVTRYNPDTDQEEQVVVDLSKPGDLSKLPAVGSKRPPFFTREQRARMAGQLTGEAAGEPGAAPGPGPSGNAQPPDTSPNVPPPAVPTGAAPTTGGAPSSASGPPPGQSVTTHLDKNMEPSFAMGPGQTTVIHKDFINPQDNQLWTYEMRLDARTNRVLQNWTPVGRARAGDEQYKLEQFARQYAVDPGDQRYPQLLSDIRAAFDKPGSEMEKLARLKNLESVYGKRGAPTQAPTPGAPAPAPTQAPVTTPAPTAPPPTGRPAPAGGGGSTPIPPPPPGASDLEIQDWSAREQARQKANATALETDAATRARLGAERTSPQGVEKSSDYMLPSGKMAPVGLTDAEYTQMGARRVSPAQRENLAQLGPAMAVVTTIDGLSKRFITANTGPEAARQAVRLWASGKWKSNPTVALYMKEANAFNGNLTKSLGGDTGTLSNQDINRITNALPSLGDTRAIREGKIGVLNNLLETAIDAKRRVIFGDQTPEEARAAIKDRVDGFIKRMEDLHSQAAPVHQQQFGGSGTFKVGAPKD